MTYDYSEVFDFIIQKRIGKMYEWKPIGTPYGQFEALIYFSCPYWFTDSEKSMEKLEEFSTLLGEIGTKWRIINADELIKDRMAYYWNLLDPIMKSTDINFAVKQEFMIMRTVYHLVYTQPLATFPINENDFKLMPPSFKDVCPYLNVLVNTLISLGKNAEKPVKSDEIYIVNALGQSCTAKQEIDEYGTSWVIIRTEDGNVYDKICNHTLDEMKKIWSQN